MGNLFYDEPASARPKSVGTGPVLFQDQHGNDVREGDVVRFNNTECDGYEWNGFLFRVSCISFLTVQGNVVEGGTAAMLVSYRVGQEVRFNKQHLELANG